MRTEGARFVLQRADGGWIGRMRSDQTGTWLKLQTVPMTAIELRFDAPKRPARIPAPHDRAELRTVTRPSRSGRTLGPVGRRTVMHDIESGHVRSIAARLVRTLLGGTGDEAQTSPNELDDHARRELIAQAAFELAAQRDFAPGQALDDWLAAEAAVDDELRVPPRR
jgi:hypothetical protein